MPYFIITVDTEGDNLWKWKKGDPISTQNAVLIPKFQELCEKYNFKPVYLMNYEMVCDKALVSYLTDQVYNDLCEIGIHIHAWNSPPEYELESMYDGNAYITEYPNEIVYEKLVFLKDKIESEFGTRVVSHRSGRWAIDEAYFKILEDVGIKVDCSITPQIDFSKMPGTTVNHGPNYLKEKIYPHNVRPGLLEVPMTTRKIRRISTGSLKHRIKSVILGDDFWMRLLKKDMSDFFYLKKYIEKERKCDYVEFMIHSSELLPGGNPYFKTVNDVNHLWFMLDCVFESFSNSGYVGITLNDYANLVNDKNYSR